MNKCELCESETPNKCFCERCVKRHIFSVFTAPRTNCKHDPDKTFLDLTRPDLRDDIEKFLSTPITEDPSTTVQIDDYKITIEYDDWYDFIRVEKNGVQKLFEKIS